MLSLERCKSVFPFGFSSSRRSSGARPFDFPSVMQRLAGDLGDTDGLPESGTAFGSCAVPVRFDLPCGFETLGGSAAQSDSSAALSFCAPEDERGTEFAVCSRMAPNPGGAVSECGVEWIAARIIIAGMTSCTPLAVHVGRHAPAALGSQFNRWEAMKTNDLAASFPDWEMKLAESL